MAEGTGRSSQEFELEFVPARNFRIEIGSAFAAHDINGVPGLEDRRQLSWQGFRWISATGFSIGTRLPSA